MLSFTQDHRGLKSKILLSIKICILRWSKPDIISCFVADFPRDFIFGLNMGRECSIKLLGHCDLFISNYSNLN